MRRSLLRSAALRRAHQQRQLDAGRNLSPGDFALKVAVAEAGDLIQVRFSERALAASSLVDADEEIFLWCGQVDEVCAAGLKVFWCGAVFGEGDQTPFEGPKTPALLLFPPPPTPGFCVSFLAIALRRPPSSCVLDPYTHSRAASEEAASAKAAPAKEKRPREVTFLEEGSDVVDIGEAESFGANASINGALIEAYETTIGLLEAQLQAAQQSQLGEAIPSQQAIPKSRQANIAQPPEAFPSQQQLAPALLQQRDMPLDPAADVSKIVASALAQQKDIECGKEFVQLIPCLRVERESISDEFYSLFVAPLHLRKYAQWEASITRQMLLRGISVTQQRQVESFAESRDFIKMFMENTASWTTKEHWRSVFRPFLKVGAAFLFSSGSSMTQADAFIKAAELQLEVGKIDLKALWLKHSKSEVHNVDAPVAATRIVTPQAKAQAPIQPSQGDLARVMARLDQLQSNSRPSFSQRPASSQRQGRGGRGGYRR